MGGFYTCTMKIALLVCCFFVLYPLAAQTNFWQIRGLVFSAGGEPLPGALVLADESVRTTTNADGVFEFRLSARPQTLSARALGYFPQRVLLDTLRWKGQKTSFQFALLPNDVQLGEVTISNKAVEVLFEEDNSSNLLDYQFAGPDLLLLVKEKKRHVLRLTSESGRVLSELHFPEAGQRLHRSCTGAFHLIGTQWAWEIALSGRQMDTFPRYPIHHFRQFVEPCVVKQDGYYCRKFGPFQQSVRYFYVDAQGKISPLETILDEKGEQAAFDLYTNFLARTPFLAPPTYVLTGGAFAAITQPAYLFALPPLPPASLEEETWEKAYSLPSLMRSLDPYNNDQLATLGTLQNLRADSVYAPMFQLRDSVFLFNPLHGWLLKIAPKTGMQRKDSLSFHLKNRGWRKEILVDAALQRAYGRFFSNKSGLTLTEINLDNGSAGKSYPLPQAPLFASNFQLRNGTVYCIGQSDVANPNKQLYKINLY